MGNNDPNLIRQLETIIRDLIAQELRKARFWKSITGVVTAVDGTSLDVELAEDGVTVTVENKTGETILTNDLVEVVKVNNSNVRYYALIKL